MKTRFVFGRVIAPAVIALVAALPASAEPNMDKYNKSCAMCHNGALPMAPKTHDAKAWEPRLAKGMDALLASVKNGLNAMPATGMCNDCTDEEYKALITYMSTPK
jgi:cytochrome c5